MLPHIVGADLRFSHAEDGALVRQRPPYEMAASAYSQIVDAQGEARDPASVSLLGPCHSGRDSRILSIISVTDNAVACC
jgi:hypothetical protein